jgi:hypothetical protein
MLRFTSNRWWAFVLTLCLFTACFFLITVQTPSVACASNGSFLPADEAPPPQPGIGDPDVPITPAPGKVSVIRVAGNGWNQAVPESWRSPVGDGKFSTSVWMQRLRLFLLGLRNSFLRY